MGYLVVSRKVGQRIKIGDDIEIMVADVCQGKVDIAIKAPKSLKIQRMVRHIEEEKNESKNRAG